MKIVATTSLPAVDRPNADRPNADRWNAARSRQYFFKFKLSSFANIFLIIHIDFFLRDAFKKKNYVDRETVPKVGRGGSTIPL